jgi:hypothetical protein
MTHEAIIVRTVFDCAAPGGAGSPSQKGLQADVDIKQGQKVVIGRASVAESALFVVLTAQVVN